MPLNPQIQALVDKLQADSADLDLKQEASHAALQDLANTTQEENGLVIQAQAHAATAIGAAQSTADAAIAETDAAKVALDTDIDNLIETLTAAKV